MASTLRWHLGHLDSLRGIAVLGVVMVHSALWGLTFLPMPLWIQEVASTGQRGVSLFFIVSAFTLFLSYDNRREERRPILNFFVRRFFRLAPMFYIAILLAHVFERDLTGSRQGTLLAFFFLHGLFPQTITSGALGGWSVADEALFYLCLPLLFARIRNLRTAMIWLGVACPVGFFASQFFAARFPEQAGFCRFSSFYVEFPVFLMGITGYFIWKELVPREATQTTQQASLLLLGVTALVYVALIPFKETTLYPTSIVCLLLLITLSLHPWRVLVNPFTRFLGKISYSLYLLHFFIFREFQRIIVSETSIHPVLQHPRMRFFGCFLITLLFTIPLATATWRWIEEPGIRAGRRLIAHLEARSAKRRQEPLVPPLGALSAAENSPDAQF